MDIESIKYPACLDCEHCKFVKRNMYGEWKIKCKKKVLGFRVPWNYPQIGCRKYKTKGVIVKE